MRLDRFLSERTPFSRSQLKTMIAAGKVTCNGVVLRRPEAAVSEQDAITLNGEAVRTVRTVTLLLHKPAGVVSATEDATEKTVLDLLPQQWQGQGLFPVGRLDKDTTGFLLLTNDGDLSHRLLSPKKHVPKYYIAQLAQPFAPEDARRLAAGIELGNGEVCLPVEADVLSDDRSKILLCLHEGKYHQVKRMLAALGNHVEQLHRIGMGGLELPPNLAPGEAIALLDKELCKLLNYKTEILAFRKMQKKYSS